MIEKITEGFNLAFRWMGIWLACNLVTGVIFRAELWLEQRRTRRAARRLERGPKSLPVIPQRRPLDDEDLPEQPPEREAVEGPDSDEQSGADVDASANQ